MIVVVGSSNTDMIINCTHLPQKGETVMGKFLVAGGGKGANQAVAAARLGQDVCLLCCIGQDDFGKNALAGLQSEGINTDQVMFNNALNSGVALILVDDKGDNMIAFAAGANGALSPDHIQKSCDILQRADVVLCDFAVPKETIAAAARIAREGGALVLLTPAPPLDMDRSFLELIDIITPNETEAQALTGIVVRDLEDAEKAGQTLVNQGVKNAILTLGERGAMVCTESETFHINARTVPAVDTTAAGDSFSGALAVALAERKSLHESVTFANLAASITVTRHGAQPSLPTREEVQALIS